MLRLKFLAVLGIAAVVAGFANPVSAQSSRSVDGKGYSLSGDSLMGINERTANQDFPVFFNTQPSTATPVNNNVEQNPFTNTSYRKTEQQVQIGGTSVLMQPADKTGDRNDGVQVKFDLTNTDRRDSR